MNKVIVYVIWNLGSWFNIPDITDLGGYVKPAYSTVQYRTGQDRTGQDRTVQDSTGQDRTGQDRTGQDSFIVPDLDINFAAFVKYIKYRNIKV